MPIVVVPRLVISGDGKAVVGYAGSRTLCDLAETFGLQAGLSAAMAATKQRRRCHDRGEVLVDLAVMIADGGTTISDLVTLCDQPGSFGPMASVATAWRTLHAVTETVLAEVAAARANARVQAWATEANPGVYVVHIDATLVGVALGEAARRGQLPNSGTGVAPVLAYLDGSGEATTAFDSRTATTASPTAESLGRRGVNGAGNGFPADSWQSMAPCDARRGVVWVIVVVVSILERNLGW